MIKEMSEISENKQRLGSDLFHSIFLCRTHFNVSRDGIPTYSC